MSENESLDMTKDQENGQITYANEVIATIVSVATTEVEGISGISGAGAISGILGKGRAPRGVRVDITDGSVKVDISVTVDYGIPIQKVGRNVQENVRKSIESMTGLHVERVDLHVVGVSFEKENQELQQGQKLALSLEEQEAPESLPAEPEEAASDEETGEQDADEAGEEPETEGEEGEPEAVEDEPGEAEQPEEEDRGTQE